MVTKPDDTPVTTPDSEPTVATPVLLLDHTPPGVPSVSVIVAATHTDDKPVMTVGSGLTTSVAVMMQVDPMVYVIIAVPAVTPVAIPVVEPMVATPRLLLLHVPPGVGSPKAVVSPTHTLSVPVIGNGNGLTVTVAVIIHPVGIVYVIIAVPADTPVTMPLEVPTVAIAVFPLLQVPLGVTSLRLVVKPTHMLSRPVIGAGSGLTTNVAVIIHPVPIV